MNSNSTHLRRAIGARTATSTALLVGTLAVPGTLYGWLGGFEAADGYRDFFNPVQDYNAGQHGANSGYGGAYSPITPNTGLWQAITGGFNTGNAYSYVTGHFGNDRMWVNHGIGSSTNRGLVLTTGHEGWGANPLKFRYNVDQYDLGGVAPSATGGQRVDVSFWTKGDLPGTDLGGFVVEGYYGQSVEFLDASGNIGFSLGLTQRAGGDHVTYWNGTQIFESTLLPSWHRFDRWDVTLDLAAQTVTAKFFHFTSGITHNVVTNQPLMATMSDFVAMTFRSSDGDNNMKQWAVDDFGMHATPAPGTALLLGMGGIVAMRRRRN